MSYINYDRNARSADHASRVRAILDLPQAKPQAKPALSIGALIAIGAFIGVLIAIVVL